MRERGMIQIEFRINEVSKAFFDQLKFVTESVTHLYHAVQNYAPVEFYPLQTDNFPVVGFDTTDFKPEEHRKNALIWLFKKAFEEFIAGLTLALIEAHKFAKYRELSEKTKTKEWVMLEVEVLEAIELIQLRPQTLHFPTLIKEIEETMGFDLALRNEIISVNQIRNCLVHGNGRVRSKDINDTQSGMLVLRYVDLVFYYDKDGEFVKLTWEQKKEGFNTSRLAYEYVFKTVSFKQGEDVLLDQNIFNGVALTCSTFINALQEKLPFPPPVV